MNLTVPEDFFPLRLIYETPMTDDELLRFCSANEIMHTEREPNGHIRVKPIAGCAVSQFSVAVNRALAEWTERDGRGEAFLNGGFSLPDGSMRGAYLAWMHNDKWKRLSKREREGFARVCPDFVVEIVGPYDTLADMQDKMDQWIANGAQVGWLIDPEEQTVTIYRPGQPPEPLNHTATVHGTGPIAGFELVMARIWA
jgi:Uma2 family endonuclease